MSAAALFTLLIISFHFALAGLMVFVFETTMAFNSRVGVAQGEMETYAWGLRSQSRRLTSKSRTTKYDRIALLSTTVSNAPVSKFDLG